MANPLCLMMPILPGTSLAALGSTLAEFQPQVTAAMEAIGTVHFARFTLFDRSQPNLLPDFTSAVASDSLVIGVITEYDGDFNQYIGDFAAQLGDVFDALLKFVVGGAALIPVVNNVAAFEDFITANDASQNKPNTGLYSAYPLTVQKILALS